MLRLLRPLSFIPAILMMYMIFGFSSQDGNTSAQLSYKVSYEIVEVGAKILGEELEPWQIDSIATRYHGIVRKIAHMTEYFLLAVAVAFPLYVYGLRGILLMFIAGLFCVAFACGDEYHQSYVAGRGPSKRDVLIDSFGVFWGIILVRIVGWTGRKTIFRPWFSKKKKASDNQIPSNSYQNEPDYRTLVSEQHYNYPPYQSAPYRSAPYPEQYQQYPPRTGGPYNGYPNHTYQNPYYSGTPYYPQRQNPADNYASSDSLSEDLSFKKLMHNIKDQQNEQKIQRKRSGSQDFEEIDL